MSQLIQDQPLTALECAKQSISHGLREVLIVPGGEVETVNGVMILTAEDAHEVIASFQRHGTSVPIDYEHSTLRSESLPHGAPAAGWIESLFFNNTRGLMGLVRWNDKGRDSIRSDEFRYLSPVVLLDRKTKHVKHLHSAALTTKPAIPRMERLAANTLTKEFNTMPTERSPEMQKLIDELAGYLSLPENYTDIQLLERAIEVAKKANNDAVEKSADIEVANEVRNSLGLPKNAGVDAVKLSLSIAHDGASSKELAAMKAAETQRVVDERLQKYIDEGKLNPHHEAQMCSARKLAANDPDTFTTIMDAAVPFVPQGATIAPNQATMQRSQVVREAMHAFNHDGRLKKTTSLEAFVNMQLTEAGLDRMTDEDRKGALKNNLFNFSVEGIRCSSTRHGMNEAPI